ncbi:T-complex protein 1 subunit theta [Homalodisca vitripennis]|nr:T-complex protein 1 subunit theta [Homalodisca vitripennis]
MYRTKKRQTGLTAHARLRGSRGTFDFENTTKETDSAMVRHALPEAKLQTKARALYGVCAVWRGECLDTASIVSNNDGRLVPGAGAVEIELARQVSSYGETLPGLDQYAVTKFATALESFVKTLSDNTGVKFNEVISKLYAAHQEGKINYGFDIQDDRGAIIDAKEAEIFDLYLTVMWGLKFATNAACTILKVDQIIMAKRAGGPKAPSNRPKNDEED